MRRRSLLPLLPLLFCGPQAASALEYTDLAVTQRLALDFSVGGEPAGTVVVGLFAEVAPKTVENWATLCLDADKGYAGSSFHRIIPGFMIQGGSIGRSSIWGGAFDDEPAALAIKFTDPGLLSMVRRTSRGCA